MTKANLVTSAKKWLRITSSAFDDEILQTIEACEVDLRNAGVMIIDYNNSLIQQAVKLYLKSQFGYDENAERFSESYEYLKNSLAISGEFSGGDIYE